MIVVANTKSNKGFTEEQVTQYLKSAFESIGIEYEFKIQVGMPTLPTLPTPTPTQPKADKDEIAELVDEKKYTIGDFVTVYPTMNAVRHWNPDKFTPKNVMFALKQSLKEAGASWNKELNAYQFSTKKAFNAWVKVQKDRETK